jgi:hypothetical protein
MNTYGYNIQELWDTIKRPNLRFYQVAEGAETQTKSTGNLFNDRIAENLSNLCNEIDAHVQKAFQTPYRSDQKRAAP